MPDQPAFDFYAFWRSSAGFRVRVALNLKGLSYTEHTIDLEAGQQHSPDYLAVNPAGSVPALIQPGHPPMTQSLAILEFLEETAPTPPILPGDAPGRARVRGLCALLAADTHPLIVPRVRKYLMGSGGFDAAAWRAWQIQWFTLGLTTIETRLANDEDTGDYCHGDGITMADIVLCSIPAVMQAFKITVPGVPTVDRIVARCREHPAFAKADPFQQVGAPAA